MEREEEEKEAEEMMDEEVVETEEEERGEEMKGAAEMEEVEKGEEETEEGGMLALVHFQVDDPAVQKPQHLSNARAVLLWGTSPLPGTSGQLLILPAAPSLAQLLILPAAPSLARFLPVPSFPSGPPDRSQHSRTCEKLLRRLLLRVLEMDSQWPQTFYFWGGRGEVGSSVSLPSTPATCASGRGLRMGSSTALPPTAAELLIQELRFKDIALDADLPLTGCAFSEFS